MVWPVGDSPSLSEQNAAVDAHLGDAHLGAHVVQLRSFGIRLFRGEARRGPMNRRARVGVKAQASQMKLRLRGDARLMFSVAS